MKIRGVATEEEWGRKEGGGEERSLEWRVSANKHRNASVTISRCEEVGVVGSSHCGALQ